MSNSTGAAVSDDGTDTVSVIERLSAMRDRSAPPGLLGLVIVGLAGNVVAFTSGLSMFQYGPIGVSVGAVVVGVAAGHTVSMVGLATLKSWAIPVALFFQAAFVGLNALAENPLGVLLALTMFGYILSERKRYP